MSSLTVKDILEKSKTLGDFITHVSMIQPIGKYSISKNNFEDFWDAYCKVVYDGEACFGIAEKPQTYIPVLVDIDIKVKYTDQNNIETLYNEVQVASIVKDYQDSMRRVLKAPLPRNFICFVLEKPAYKKMIGEVEHISSGFHLHFPYTFLTKSDHENYLLPLVKKTVAKNNIFEELGIKDSSDIIDDCYTRNAWLLYGGQKAENMQPYRLSYILNEDRERISIEQALLKQEDENGIPVAYKLYDIDDNLIKLNSKNLVYYLPRILSILVWNREVCEVRQSVPFCSSSGSNMVEFRAVEFNELNLTEDLKVANRLLGMMKEEKSYADWMNIGWALYNISNGCDEGLSLWIKFSARDAAKFDEHRCYTEWGRMERRNMTIGTLHYFARSDNPDEYKLFSEENTLKYLRSGVAATHYDIAKACYEQFGSEFVCASICGKIWYRYENNRWKKIEAGVFLRNKISEDIVAQAVKIRVENDIKLSRTQNEGERAMFNVEQKQIHKLITNLKNSNFKSSCLREMEDIFFRESFLTNLNKDPWIIGFKNGVYDLKNNVFRAGIPEDYISKQMPIDYSEFDEKHKLVIEVHNYFEKVFPDTQLREYFLDIYSDIFVGSNSRKHVYFWSGCGDNAKSVTQLLFEKMLGGDYAIKLPTSLLVGKRAQSSTACPELARAGNGVRWATLQEPDKKDVINTGILKELSGNDTLYTRDLFQKGEDIKEVELMFKLQLIYNEAPLMPNADKAALNRIRVIPFESYFSDNAPESYEEQVRQKHFPKDPYFSEKIPHLLKPLAWVLLNHRKKDRKFIEPEKVKMATDAYRKKNDIMKQFADEKIICDPKAKIGLQELYILLCEWHKESLPGKSLPEKNDVKDYFVKLWGETSSVGGYWKGRRALTFEDEQRLSNIIPEKIEDGIIPSNN